MFDRFDAVVKFERMSPTDSGSDTGRFLWQAELVGELRTHFSSLANYSNVCVWMTDRGHRAQSVKIRVPIS